MIYFNLFHKNIFCYAVKSLKKLFILMNLFIIINLNNHIYLSNLIKKTFILKFY